ncbi:MAG: amino acid adenylation domain-containing protein, partial [bacterium]|nr:amino acid adenylation domain-containing protein [bacterium]
FKEFLRELKTNTLKAFENQEYQFEDLVELLKVKRDAGRNPLFDIMFALQNMDDALPVNRELKLTPRDYDSGISKFDMTFIGFEKGEGVSFHLEYCTALFKEETIQRFIGYFQQIVSAVVGNPAGKISGIEIVSAREREKILYEFNDSESPYPNNETIRELFEEQAARIPGKTAIVYRETYLTYKELNERSNQLARVLRGKGAGPGSIIGIMEERSPDMLVGILGILKTGAAYLPLEPDYPEQRIKYMLADSSVKLVANLEDPGIVSAESTNLGTADKPGDPAYVIYTSGSTGNPKGVMVEHGSLLNLLYFLSEAYPLSPADSYLLKTSFVFDVSISELFGWIWGGNRLVVLGKDEHKEPVRILDAIERSNVTHINFVPSMFSVFIDHLNQENIAKLSGLKYIFLAGEALQPDQVNRFRLLNTGVILENLYGPTEGTVYAGKYSLSDWRGEGSIPIGKPLPNMKAFVLDRDDHLQAVGAAGELCISGAGVARGYLNNPELTAASFTPLPLYPSTPLPLLYRTGDLARWQPDGNIEFLGRLDHQVKIRGFRIEPGEIESKLAGHDDVNAVVVTTVDREGGQSNDMLLCAYFVSSREIPAAEFRDYLSGHLPDYMIPSFFIPLEEIPLTAGGKVNLQALPEPELGSLAATYAAPTTKIEEKLVEIWAHTLGIDKEAIGIDHNFFELGGHSLKGTVVIAKIHKQFNVTISLSEIFKSLTIRQLAAYIEGASEDKYRALEPVEKQKFHTLSSAQKRLYILAQMEFDSVGYNMPYMYRMDKDTDLERLENAFQGLIRRHESFRTSFIMVNNEPVQRIHNHAPFKIVGTEHCSVRTAAINNFVRPFDLAEAPLIRVGLIEEGEEDYVLVVD